jgi:separase
MARMTALRRERAIELAEKHTSTQDNVSQWPTRESLDQSSLALEALPADFTEFQRSYIDVIPAKWTAISISLNESNTELILSKMQAGQSPFLLRLPLSRHSSRDADDEEFDFAQGRTELLDIIASANKSTQDARDMTKKGAKSAWWAVREALDCRLKDLLLNIQSIWIGGFRGLFSQEPRQELLLDRFHRSFQNILDKNLPSRARTKRSKKAKTILDTRILELLVGLGDPGEDADELEEPLTDLLYFVVDILQFNGERNAYDEIDFDMVCFDFLQSRRRC